MAIKEIEFEGKTREAAVEAAAAQLGLDVDSVIYRMVQQPTKGIFGIGATPAKIAVEVEVPDEKPVEAPEPENKPEKKPERPKREEKEFKLPEGYEPEKLSGKGSGGAPKAEKPAPAPVVFERKLVPVPEGDANVPVITEFLLGLLERLEIENGKVEISIDEENGSYFTKLDGSKMGVVIGRRGETLDAVQMITNLVVNRGRDEKVRVVLDSENYRDKRIATLQALANKTADKAIKYRRNQTLEPMGSYERRIIHATLSGRDHIATYSVGTDPRRKVVVAYEK